MITLPGNYKNHCRMKILIGFDFALPHRKDRIVDREMGLRPNSGKFVRLYGELRCELVAESPFS